MADDSGRADPLGSGVFHWFIVSLASACLTCALVVAAYALFRAAAPYCYSEECSTANSAGLTLLWIVTAVALVVGVLLGWQWWSRTRKGQAMPRWVRIIALIGASGLVVGYIAAGMAATSFAASGERVWLMRVAVGLAIAGCVVAAACKPPDPGGVRRIVAAIATCVAVALVASLTSALWRNERATLDATTAEEAEVPPIPVRLGQERFRLSLPYFKPQFEVAGTGFVVWTPYWSKDDAAPDLAAFDASGAPRWHYSRIGAKQEIARVGVYDDGGVLVVGYVTGDNKDSDGKQVGGREMVGLDAVTGEQLWTSTDRDMWKALDIDDGGSHLSFAVRGDTFWTGFDARTGQQNWRVPNPVRCDQVPLKTLSATEEPFVVRPADTDAQLVTVIDCSTTEQINLRVLVSDPATGEQIVDRPIPQADGQRRDTWDSLSVDWGFDDSVPIKLQKKCAEVAPSGRCTMLGEAIHLLFNYMSGASTNLPLGSIDPSYQPPGDFVLVPKDDDGAVNPREIELDTVTLMNADMTARCEYVSERWAGGNPKWLTEQLIDQQVASGGTGMQVRLVDRETCRTEALLPWPIETDKDIEARYLVPARGVTLLVQTNGDSTVDIVGYAP